jgi:hypothetical protein
VAGQYGPLYPSNDQLPPVSSRKVEAPRGSPKQRIGALVSIVVLGGRTTSVSMADDPGPHGSPGTETRNAV